MELFSKLKKENLQFRRDKNIELAAESSFLISQINDHVKSKTVEGVTPSITDDIVISEVRNSIKKLKQTYDAIPENGNETTIANIKTRIDFMVGYLPPEISPEQIKNDATDILNSLEDKTKKSMGKIIGGLKTKYGNQFDGQKVNSVIKSFWE